MNNELDKKFTYYTYIYIYIVINFFYEKLCVVTIALSVKGRNLHL